MGCWGMGITQSDEYCDVYDRFMRSYNEGETPGKITASIIAEYSSEFDDADGVMHDVYFALAKSEWMCCSQSASVLNRVKEIIESGANISFYRELGADEKDLKLRQKKLEQFWDSLQTPRAKPRQRRIDPLDRVKELPPLEVGDCYRYKYDNGYRVFAVIGYNRPIMFRDSVNCAIFEKTYNASELKTVDFLNEPVHSISCYFGEDLLGSSTIKKVAVIPVSEDKLLTSASDIAIHLGNKKDFRAAFNNSTGFKLSDLIKDV